MRRRGAHHYGASVDRFHLPWDRGGRGVASTSFQDMYEREILSSARYLESMNEDPHLRAVYRWQKGALGKHSLMKEAASIRAKYELSPDSDSAEKKTLKALLIEQKEVRLREKVVHGVYYREAHRTSRDPSMNYRWLKKVGYSAEAETMIFATQDGVIHMSGYRTRIMGAKGSGKCRYGCKSRETFGHILSSCERYNIRGGTVLEVVKAIAQTLGIRERIAPDYDG